VANNPCVINYVASFNGFYMQYVDVTPEFNP
jgi:hypothetical protein